MFVDTIRLVVREEIHAALNGQAKAPAKDWLRAGEASEVYNLPRTWFEEAGRAGKIERTKAGKYILFSRRAIEKYLEDSKNAAYKPF